MKRRTLLGSTGASLLVATVGCLGSLDETEGPASTTEIVDTEFDTLRTNAVSMADDDPDVSYEDGEITITGTFSLSDCHDVQFPDPSYDDETGILRMEVTQSRDGSGDCTDGARGRAFRAIVTIDGSPPDTVEVNVYMGTDRTVDLD